MFLVWTQEVSLLQILAKYSHSHYAYIENAPLDLMPAYNLIVEAAACALRIQPV
jgi:ferritin-like protein